MEPCFYTSASGENALRPIVGSRDFNNLRSLRAGSDILTGDGLNALHSSVAGNAVSPLLLIAPGPTRIIRSSAGMNWPGFLLEQHLNSPGERPSTAIEVHVISMLCGNSSQLCYRFGDGRAASFTERAGSVTFMPAGPIPHVRLQSAAEFTHIAFEERFIRGVIEEMEHKPAAKPAFRAGVRDISIQRILTLLTEELDARGPSGKLYVDSLAHALATRYLQLHESSRAADVHTSPLPLRILNRVKEKIEANMDTDLSLDSLANESGYSRAHFLRMFRAATGVTPHQFVLELRLKQAQNRIRQTRDRLIDIAAECGFASQSHMTTVFKKYLDLTPAEVRRNA
jgi:AraC family transcriptional regulator